MVYVHLYLKKPGQNLPAQIQLFKTKKAWHLLQIDVVVWTAVDKIFKNNCKVVIWFEKIAVWKSATLLKMEFVMLFVFLRQWLVASEALSCRCSVKKVFLGLQRY